VYHHIGYADEIFGSDVSYNVTALYEVGRAFPAQCAPVTVTTTAEELGEILAGVRVSRARAMRISLRHAQAEPLLAVARSDLAPLLVDGHHRLTRLAAAGVCTYRMHVVPVHLQPPQPYLEALPISECTPEMLNPANVISLELHLQSMARLARLRGWTEQEIRAHYPQLSGVTLN